MFLVATTSMLPTPEVESLPSLLEVEGVPTTTPAPARVLFAPTPDENGEGTFNFRVPLLKATKRRFDTPHGSMNWVLKRGVYPLTPYVDGEEEEEEVEEK